MTGQLLQTGHGLSPMQEGMLFHHLSDPRSGVDIQQIVCTMPEVLDEALLRRAWICATSRHAALRTSFQWQGVDQPLQLVHTDVELSFATIDLSHLHGDEQKRELEAFLDSDRHDGFDATQAPLQHVTCLRLGTRTVCIWTMHHLISDARGVVTVLEEVFQVYDALRRGTELCLKPARSYVEFLEWLKSREQPDAEHFWRNHLAGLHAPTPLPGEARRGEATDGSRSGECSVRLPAPVTQSLNDLALRCDVRLSTIIQGAWAILLSRHGGTDDVMFGVTRACRRSALEGASAVDDIVGIFINTLPTRVRVGDDTELSTWLSELRSQQRAFRSMEHTPLSAIRRWTDIPSGMPLFETVVVFNQQSVQGALRARHDTWKHREVRVIEKTGFPLTLYAYAEPECVLALSYDRRRFTHGGVERLLGQLRAALESMTGARLVGDVSLLSEAERHEQLVEWNDTVTPYQPERCVHELVEEQVERTPDAAAIVCGTEEISYRELDLRANRLAHRLRAMGVGPGTLVAVCLERSVDLVVGILGTLKAGGAYVPLDPDYPLERLRFILEDSDARVVITHTALDARLPVPGASVLAMDRERGALATEPGDRPRSGVKWSDLAYVIYTSGSTGRPKGVMVEHRNVANLLAAMDQRLRRPADGEGVWLAVTSLSFDIAALELFWPLSRGLKVVLARGELAPTSTSRAQSKRVIEFSLMYFAQDDDRQEAEKYRLLLEGARFADEHGFTAIWTPERHFHAFGGLYPNPAVTSAALAMITNRVAIRGGSCVLPLHHPARVAEEWSVVDNLSHGRVGVAFASGWRQDDFALAPGNYREARSVLRRSLDIVRRLWRGEAVAFPGPVEGEPVTVRTLPRPVQPELPCWITAAGSPDTFRLAGELGASVLTHLLGQTVEEVADRIRLYREAWQQAGHPGLGHVTLMVHTFIADDMSVVYERVRGPLRGYLRSAADLIRKFGADFPLLRRRTMKETEVVDLRALAPPDMEALLDYAVDRYLHTSALLGTPASCRAMVQRLQDAGVDEIASLIDFGVPTDVVLKHLPEIAALRRVAADPGGGSLADLIRRHGVTHLQCTPSAARVLTEDPETRAALPQLRQLLVGGEALPAALAAELRVLLSGDVINMYGPTETTIWSTCHRVTDSEDPVPIGRPIGNTELFVLDERRRPLPIGVPGELFIGGDGVARGYLHDPELTAQRFERHPFRSDGGARVFRTGDVVKYRHDGCLLFLGRTDQQVKVRGHRIELGEIESVLMRHSAVKQAVVASREGPTGAALVAYYVGLPGFEPPVHELREHLARYLPNAMVPSAFVRLDALPLTPNGKIDRRALPDPAVRGSQPRESKASPRTRTEEALARIWSEVLGTPDVGVHDSFFDLGGDSLALIRVGSRIQSTLNVTVPLRVVLDAPTVAQLAAAIEQLERTR